MPLGCGCLFLMGAAVAPRLALLFAWLFTDYVSDAIDEWWMIVLGILFLPFTTIMWVLVWSSGSGVEGFDWFWIALGFFFDLASWVGNANKRTYRRPPPAYPPPQQYPPPGQYPPQQYPPQQPPNQPPDYGGTKY